MIYTPSPPSSYYKLTFGEYKGHTLNTLTSAKQINYLKWVITNNIHKKLLTKKNSTIIEQYLYTIFGKNNVIQILKVADITHPIR
jgi:hypothetical protein